MLSSRGRLDLEASLSTRLASLLLALPGLSVAGLLLWRGDRLGLKELVPLGIFAAGWLIGSLLYYYAVPTIRFDRTRGEVQRSRLPYLSAPQRIPFEQLRALQLLREHCQTRSGLLSFFSYELNLVLHDGRRTNLADHGDLEYLRENARRLRAFLDIPIWDASDVDAPRAPPSSWGAFEAGTGMIIAACAMIVGSVWIAIDTPLTRDSYATGWPGTAEWLSGPAHLALWMATAVAFFRAGFKSFGRGASGRGLQPSPSAAPRAASRPGSSKADARAEGRRT